MDYDPIALEKHIDFLKQRFQQEGDDLLICQVCHFPADYHVSRRSSACAYPEYWPADVAIRYLELELGSADTRTIS